MALTPDGHTAVSASPDQTLRVWDVATGTLIAIYPLDAPGKVIAVAAGNRIVAGTGSGQLHFLTLNHWPR
jgi:WD40 repeat protein